FYEKALTLSLRHRLTTVVIGLAFFIGSVGLFKILPTSLVSRIDKGETSINVELPPGSELPETYAVVQRVVKIAQSHPESDVVYASCGNDQQVNKGWVHVSLKPKEQRTISQDQFEDGLRKELAGIPGARITFGGGWGSGKVEICLTGYDPLALDETAQQLTTEMRTIPQLTDIHTTANDLRPEIVVRPDSARAAEQGISVEAIARTASVATLGDNAANLPKFDLNDRQIPIVVQIDPKFRQKMSVIGNLRVAGNGGRLVPLSSVAKVTMDSGLFKIDRYDRARQASITAKFGANFSLGQAFEAI